MKRSRLQYADGAWYQGTAGIGLFLLEASLVAGHRRLATTAEAALRHAATWATDTPETRAGLYTGLVGTACSLARFAAMTGRDEFRQAAMNVVARLPAAKAPNGDFDLLTGVAGGIVGLLRIAILAEEPSCVEVARAFGDHLIARANRGTGGWSWGSSPMFARDLTGLSHGGSGIGHALLELHNVTGEGKYLFAAEQAFAYEDEFFDTLSGNWLDLRHLTLPGLARDYQGDTAGLKALAPTLPRYEPASMTAWCHGAPGVALARLRAFQLLERPEYERQARAAIATTKAAVTHRAEAGEFSLCHGVAGLGEALLFAAATVNDTAAADLVRTSAATAAERYELGDGAWPCGTADRVNDPSLMIGESGIGYFFLRLATPETMPSVLLAASEIPRSRVCMSSGAVGDDDAGAAALRYEYVNQYFGRIRGVVGRLGKLDDENSARTLEGGAPTPNATRWVLSDEYHRIERTILTEPDAEQRQRLADAFAPERARYQLGAHVRYRCDEFLDAIGSGEPNDSLSRTARIRLQPETRLVTTMWDWDAWLRTALSGIEPAQECVTYAAYSRAGMTNLTRLSPLATAVLNALTTADTLQQVGAHISTMLTNRISETQCCEIASRQLLNAQRAGLVTIECGAECPGTW